MDFESMDISNVSLDWQPPMRNILDQVNVIVLIAILVIFNYFAGTFFLVSLIFHEKFGEDPQKRSLVNQLVSQLSKLSLVHYWLILPPNMFRLFGGELSYNDLLALFFIGSTYLVAAGLATLEILWIRFYTIVVKKRMLLVIDDFFAQYFQVTNVTLGGFLAMVGCYSDEWYNGLKRSLRLPQFLPIFSQPKTLMPRILGSTVVIVLLALIIVCISVKLAKRKSNSLIESISQSSTNNSPYNGDLVENLILGVMCSIGASGPILLFMGNHVDIVQHQTIKAFMMMLSSFFHIFFSMTILPGIAFASNPRIRKLISSEIRNLLL